VELGLVIASLSLGAPRRFLVKHRKERRLRLSLDLTGGSVVRNGRLKEHMIEHQTERIIGY
jgi:alkylated DNA repair dioxygenase AlkB